MRFLWRRVTKIGKTFVDVVTSIRQTVEFKKSGLNLVQRRTGGGVILELSKDISKNKPFYRIETKT